MGSNSQTRKRRLHPLAVGAFILSLVGIPLLGLVTGAVAAVLGSIALTQVTSSRRHKGSALATAAIVIGIGDIALWVALLGLTLDPGANPWAQGPELPAFPDSATMEHAPEAIGCALRANVLLVVEKQSTLPLFSAKLFTGSGIIVGETARTRLILSSRHLVDPCFSTDRPGGDAVCGKVKAYFYDGSSYHARVTWVAPDGVDLALLTVGGLSSDATISVPWSKEPVTIGEKVFAVGNPHDLSWSYTEGVISGVRQSIHGPVKLSVLQTQAPINPGSSGGGLYTMNGDLLGVVSWTRHKASAEGISFAISFRDFLKLYEGSREPE